MVVGCIIALFLLSSTHAFRIVAACSVGASFRAVDSAVAAARSEFAASGFAAVVGVRDIRSLTCNIALIADFSRTRDTVYTIVSVVLFVYTFAASGSLNDSVTAVVDPCAVILTILHVVA